jgi:hypothetical protein
MQELGQDTGQWQNFQTEKDIVRACHAALDVADPDTRSFLGRVARCVEIPDEHLRALFV